MTRVTYPSYAETPLPQMMDDAIEGRQSWSGKQLSSADWLIPVSKTCIAELDEIVRSLKQHPRPLQQLDPKDFRLTACANLMSRVQTQLQSQTGLAILDRIPVERYRLDDNKAIYWLLTSMLSRVVAQKWDGTLLYDVKDSGQSLGHGIRRSVTNLQQPFHTDGAWLDKTPEVVSLFCLQTAQTGGQSRFISLLTVHNELRQRHPDLLVRLYRPFLWDRQAEHSPEDVPYRSHPVYQYDGQTLTARYYDDYIRKGYHLANEALDHWGEEALDTLQTIIDDPQYRVEFGLETGQIQYLNNHQFAHARTAFIDDPERSASRHLIRCWGRSEGTPHLDG